MYKFCHYSLISSIVIERLLAESKVKSLVKLRVLSTATLLSSLYAVNFNSSDLIYLIVSYIIFGVAAIADLLELVVSVVSVFELESPGSSVGITSCNFT